MKKFSYYGKVYDWDGPAPEGLVKTSVPGVWAPEELAVPAAVLAVLGNAEGVPASEADEAGLLLAGPDAADEVLVPGVELWYYTTVETGYGYTGAIVYYPAWEATMDIGDSYDDWRKEA